MRFSRNFATRLLPAVLCLPCVFGEPFCSVVAAQSVVRQVRVHGAKDVVEIEIEASDRITPQTQVLTGPDRLVIDFPNALPGGQLRNRSVNQGEIKDIRFGRFQASPPVTRLVLDLRSAQSYQVFPYGRTVMVKVMNNTRGETASAGGLSQPQTQANLVTANFTTSRESIHPDASKPLDVTFRDDLLTIHANKATLSQILYAVQQRTGADISTPAGTEQEKVVADFGPGPAQEVLAHLLNGSRFNFLILNAADDPRRLDRVILTPRVEGAATPLSPVLDSNDADSDQQPVPPAPGTVQAPPPGGPPVQIPPPRPQVDLPPDESAPDQ